MEANIYFALIMKQIDMG